jgi:hypothetical protein
MDDRANMDDTAKITTEQLDAPLSLAIVLWRGKLHCAYLNDYRIAGGKPWGGGDVACTFQTTLWEIACSYKPLRDALGLDHLGDTVGGGGPDRCGSDDGPKLDCATPRAKPDSA